MAAAVVVGPWNDNKKHSDRERWVCIYPAYINSKKTLAQGRCVPKDKAVENPTYQEIRDVLAAAGLRVGVENKLYSRERSKELQYRGRIRVQLKNDDGSPFNPEFPTSNNYGSAAISKESLTAELSALYNASHIETLVSQEMSKQSTFSALASNSDYGVSKTSGGDVDFSGGGCGEFRNGLPRIVDLCVEDKKRILQLINELANCKEEKEITSKELNTLKQTVQQLQKEISNFNDRFAAQKETLAMEVENLVSSRDNLTLEIENLQNCVRIQKNEIDKQTACISALRADKKQLGLQVTEQESKIRTLSESLNKKNEQKVTKSEGVQVSTFNIDGRKMLGGYFHHTEKSSMYQTNDKVNVPVCSMKNKAMQKIEDWDQMLISELFFRSKDVPETLEPIFFKNPCQAQPTQTWDTLL